MVLVGIRYCGGCNPQIDRTGLVERLQEETRKRHLDVAFTTDRDRVADITLLVNGCIHGCLEEEFLQAGKQTSYISVKGEMVGGEYIKETDIPEFLASDITKRFHFAGSK
jgi:hypothetical protein